MLNQNTTTEIRSQMRHIKDAHRLLYRFERAAQTRSDWYLLFEVCIFAIALRDHPPSCTLTPSVCRLQDNSRSTVNSYVSQADDDRSTAIVLPVGERGTFETIVVFSLSSERIARAGSSLFLYSPTPHLTLRPPLFQQIADLSTSELTSLSSLLMNTIDFGGSKHLPHGRMGVKPGVSVEVRLGFFYVIRCMIARCGDGYRVVETCSLHRFHSCAYSLCK